MTTPKFRRVADGLMTEDGVYEIHPAFCGSTRPAEWRVFVNNSPYGPFKPTFTADKQKDCKEWVKLQYAAQAS